MPIDRRFRLAALAVLAAGAPAAYAVVEEEREGLQDAPAQTQPGRTPTLPSKPSWPGRGALPADRPQIELSVSLVDRDRKASQGAATVRVDAGGLQLVDPDEVDERPGPRQGHLHYRVDGGPIVATVSTKLSFHGLEPGSHVIEVTPAGNDHAPIGPTRRLDVTIQR